MSKLSRLTPLVSSRPLSDFQQGQVEVALRRQRRGRGAGGADLIGTGGAAEHGDSISAVHQSPRDVQQGSDMSDGRQRCDENL